MVSHQYLQAIYKWAISIKNQNQLSHHPSPQLDFYLVHNCPLSPASSQWHLTCCCLGNLAKSQALVSLAWSVMAQQLCQLLIINLTSMLLTNLWNGVDVKSNHSVYVLSTITSLITTSEIGPKLQLQLKKQQEAHQLSLQEVAQGMGVCPYPWRCLNHFFQIHPNESF